MRRGVIRLGKLDFLNALPVYLGLEEQGLPVGPGDGEYRFDLIEVGGDPVALNRLLAEARLEIAPASSVAFLSHPEAYDAVPGLCIASAGAVGSVVLFGHLPVAELDGKVVALPGNSATSVALLQVLARSYWGVEPKYVEWPGRPVLPNMLAAADAALLIGDEALRSRRQYPHLFQADLGRSWWDLTGLPMVFAVWAVRRAWAKRYPDAAAWAGACLRRAQETGMGMIGPRLAGLAERHGLSETLLREYFFGCLKYGLGDAEWKGMEAFRSLLLATGVAEMPAGVSGDGITDGHRAGGCR